MHREAKESQQLECDISAISGPLQLVDKAPNASATPSELEEEVQHHSRGASSEEDGADEEWDATLRARREESAACAKLASDEEWLEKNAPSLLQQFEQRSKRRKVQSGQRDSAQEGQRRPVLRSRSAGAT